MFSGDDPNCLLSNTTTPLPNTTSSTGGIPGGWNPIAVTEIPSYVLSQVYRQLPYVANEVIIDASSQVVAGVNYKLDYSNSTIVYATCSLPGPDGMDPTCACVGINANSPIHPCTEMCTKLVVMDCDPHCEKRVLVEDTCCPHYICER